MEAWKNFAQSRVRNQVSNVLLFGSIIGITASGLVAGTASGVILVSRTSAHDWPSVIQLLVVVMSTVGGFSLGVFASLLASPVILRYAFFATEIGVWNGIKVYSAADEDLPGRHPNIFVAGFAFGIGAFKPAIFVAEGAIRVLPRESLQAVFAHEASHLECNHLSKRVTAGVLTFVGASFLTSIALIGLHWSGYTEMGGAFSAVAGILPAVLTWMAIRQLLWNQEIEADSHAMTKHQVRPEALINALETLQNSIGGQPHPLVATRLEICRAKIKSTKPGEGAEDSPRKIAA